MVRFLKKSWNINTKIVLVVIGALVILFRKLKKSFG